MFVFFLYLLILILSLLYLIFYLKGISFQLTFGIPISVSTKLFPKIFDFREFPEEC